MTPTPETPEAEPTLREIWFGDPTVVAYLVILATLLLVFAGCYAYAALGLTHP